MTGQTFWLLIGFVEGLCVGITSFALWNRISIIRMWQRSLEDREKILRLREKKFMEKEVEHDPNV